MTSVDHAYGKRALEIHHLLTSVPTSPFREQRVGNIIDAYVAENPRLEMRQDSFGNHLVSIKGAEQTDEPIIAVAHIDHPAFMFLEPSYLDDASGKYHVRGFFEGRVNDEFFPDASVLVYSNGTDPKPVRGKVIEFTERLIDEDNRVVVIELESYIDDPTLAVWDLPLGATQDGDLISANVCDDLAGVASLLAAMEELTGLDQVPDFHVLLTRAEEAGFCGLLMAIDEGELKSCFPPLSHFISVEISSETDSIKLGDGVIIRLGDKQTTFCGMMTNMFFNLGLENKINCRRALMDKGTCEATPLVMKGFSTAGLCIPVRNYHNMNMETSEIDQEHISMNDLDAMTSLLVEAAQIRHFNLSMIDRSHDGDSLEWEIFRRKGFQFLSNTNAERATKPGFDAAK